jgi:deazaflavin-dependent oxidoreductase (nitroreductase family)
VDLKQRNQLVIQQFRSGGPVEGMHRERLILLTTRGRKSGHERTTPMMFHREGDLLLVIASIAGAKADPDWYRNLVANPRVTVEVGDQEYQAIARPTEGEERERLWTAIKESYPFFADHEVKAGREIPVVALERL